MPSKSRALSLFAWCISITALCVSITMLLFALMCNDAAQPASTIVAGPRVVEGVRPIEDLGGGWWLVEVTTACQCDNPFPFLGGPKVNLRVPHLIRMRQSELEMLIKREANEVLQ